MIRHLGDGIRELKYKDNLNDDLDSFRFIKKNNAKGDCNELESKKSDSFKRNNFKLNKSQEPDFNLNKWKENRLIKKKQLPYRASGDNKLDRKGKRPMTPAGMNILDIKIIKI